MPEKSEYEIYLSFLQRDFKIICEEYGLAGEWCWLFVSGEQRWSPGLIRLLGLETKFTTANYKLFYDLVYHDDRPRIVSSDELAQGNVLPSANVRLVRPSGTMIAVLVLSEIRVSPEGRPISASGVVLNVTEIEQLRRLQARDRRQRQALYLTSYTTTYFMGVDRLHKFPPEVAQVHGPSLQEINVDPFVMTVPKEREAFRARAWDLHDRQLNFQGTSHERLANGEVWQFRIVAVPVWDVNRPGT